MHCVRWQSIWVLVGAKSQLREDSPQSSNDHVSPCAHDRLKSGLAIVRAQRRQADALSRYGCSRRGGLSSHCHGTPGFGCEVFHPQDQHARDRWRETDRAGPLGIWRLERASPRRPSTPTPRICAIWQTISASHASRSWAFQAAGPYAAVAAGDNRATCRQLGARQSGRSAFGPASGRQFPDSIASAFWFCRASPVHCASSTRHSGQWSAWFPRLQSSFAAVRAPPADRAIILADNRNASDLARSLRNRLRARHRGRGDRHADFQPGDGKPAAID